MKGIEEEDRKEMREGRIVDEFWILKDDLEIFLEK